jgi:hypothetical protein
MNWKSIFSTGLTTLVFSVASFAQQRFCDMKITLISPAEGQVLQPLAHFDITVKIENLGTDSLLAGDTVYYNTPMMILFVYNPYILEEAIPPGQSAVVVLENVPNVNENPSDEVVDFCVRVMDKRDTLDNGSFEDSLESNNNDCNEVTIISGQTGIDELQAKDLFSIYPNPASDKIHLQFRETRFRPSEITVSDWSGRVLKTLATPGMKQETIIDISDLSAGMYWLKCSDDTRQIFRKFIKR